MSHSVRVLRAPCKSTYGHHGISVTNQFKHVNGPVGTHESICMYCLLTVAISRSEKEIGLREMKHKCKTGIQLTVAARFNV
jgi:hypothetical protein